MKYLKLLLFIFIVSSLNAQFPMGGNQGPTIKGKIEGVLIDSISKEPIGFASLVLRKNGSSKDLDGILSEENGKFSFENVKVGKFDILISFIGYKDKKVTLVETTLKKPDLELDKVLLVSTGITLDAVEVKEDRALIENKVDRIVYNAENDASIAGGDATDVLRKVPLLTVDLNGNVSLRGSQNVRILINGKPSGMFSNNVADALKMFPADQIKKVEVITSPSAKYDAEGTGGLINIITSKQNIEGIAGSVNASVGIRQNSLFSSLNAGKGRLGFSSSAAIFYSNPAEGNLTFDRSEFKDGVKISSYTQSGMQTTSRLGGNGNASVFYDFNGYNSINSSLNFRGFGFDVDGTTSGSISNSLANFNDYYSKSNNGDNFNGGFDWNTDYTKKFENQKDRELSLAFQYTKDNNDQDFNVNEVHSFLTEINRNSNIFNDGDNNEYTFQVDYTHPFKNSIKLETGAKSVLRRIVSDYQNTNSINGQIIKNEALSDLFNYNQDVTSAYASLNFILAKKWNFITGVRYENTAYNGSFAKPENQDFSNSYFNLLPNFTVSRNLPNFKSIKLSYNQRIQRPSLAFINPFINNTDFLNRVIGNPFLLPEIADQIELGYNTNFKGFTIFSAVYYKLTSDIIEQILKVNNGISENTFLNIGNNNSLGLNLFTTKTIKKLTVRGGGNIFTYNSKGIVNNQVLERNTYEYNLFFGGDYSISGSLKADFFGFFKSPKRSVQGDNPAFSIYGMGIRKEFKNSSLGISLIEPHTPDKVFKSSVVNKDFSQISSFSLPFRSIGINYRYKFGNVDFKERKTKIKNNDLKTGDDAQQSSGSPTRN